MRASPPLVGRTPDTPVWRDGAGDEESNKMLTSSRIPAAPPSLERLAPRCIPPTQSQIPRGAEAGAPALRQIVQWTLAAALIRGHFAKARVRVPRRPLHCLPSPDAHLELYIHFSDCGQKWRQRSGYDWGTRTASACASPAGRQPCKPPLRTRQSKSRDAPRRRRKAAENCCPLPRHQNITDTITIQNSITAVPPASLVLWPVFERGR